MPPPKGYDNFLEGPGDYTTTKLVHSDTYEAISPLKCDYSGRSVFIAGASKGIGRAIALSYARAGATNIAIGARSDMSVLVADLKAAAKTAARSNEPQVLPVKLDVLDEKSVQSAVRTIEIAFGGQLDVLVIAAGVFAGMAKLQATKADEWWSNFTSNLRGPYLIIRACLPLLLKSHLKTVVTLSSVGAHCITPTASGYQTSKLAVLRLMEFVAAENAADGLTALTVHPGNVLTDIVGNGEGMDPKMKAIFTETPEICADSVTYLTQEPRTWLSGRYVNVTWDMPELVGEEKKKEIIDGDKLKVRLVV